FRRQCFRAPVPRSAHIAGAGAGAPVEFRIRGASAVRDRACAEIVTLQRFTAHEPRLGGPRCDTLAHDCPAQRADTVHQKQASRARALQRQKIRKQAAVEEIDRQHAARRIGATHAIESVGQFPDIVSLPMGGDDELADGGGVAQTEIEPLRADRCNDVRSFPMSATRPAPKRAAVSTISGKTPRPGSTSILPRIECERRSTSAAISASVSIERLATSAGSTTKTRLERRRGSGTNVNGPASGRNSVDVSWWGRL